MDIDKILQIKRIDKPILSPKDMLVSFIKNYKEEGSLEKLIKNLGDNIYNYKISQELWLFLRDNWKDCDKSGLSETTKKISESTITFTNECVDLNSRLFGVIKIKYIGGNSFINCLELFPTDILYMEHKLIQLLIEDIRDKRYQDVSEYWQSCIFNI